MLLACKVELVEGQLEVFFFDAELQVNLVVEKGVLVVVLRLQILIVDAFEDGSSLHLHLYLEVENLKALVSAQLAWHYLSKSVRVALNFAFP